MHTKRDKDKLLARVRRIRGQVEALERSVEAEADSEKIMHLIAGVRGAVSGLMGEVVAHHIQYHMTEDDRPDVLKPEARQALIDVIHTYIK
ncbi:MAG: metal/formaldehyde-sensitive transcriptional repressor [Asticcacaulis sp.]|uniref:metal/formaldehyde-sensitive transcriptional repressor n=1 Tax=Asticcacaulis sp. TaxID=1872648 RepID=UPI0039E3CC02